MTKRIFCMVLAAAWLLDGSPSPAAADDPRARAIMARVDARDDGDNQIGQMEKEGFAQRRNRVFSGSVNLRPGG